MSHARMEYEGWRKANMPEMSEPKCIHEWTSYLGGELYCRHCQIKYANYVLTNAGCLKCKKRPCACNEAISPEPPPPPPLPKAHALFEEAEGLINGERRKTYSPYNEEAPRIAAMWSAILKHPVQPRQVALMMIALKLERLACSNHHDSLVDLVGYAGLLAEMEAPDAP